MTSAAAKQTLRKSVTVRWPWDRSPRAVIAERAQQLAKQKLPGPRMLDGENQ